MYVMNFTIILFIQLIVLCGSAVVPGCEIDPFVSNAPLLIRSGTSKILYPSYNKTTVRFNVGDTVEFSCPQTTLLVDGARTESIVEATCISNQLFRLTGKKFLWNQISCDKTPVSTSRFVTGSCGSNTRLAEIGFQLDSTRFLHTMTVCFNTKTQSSLWCQTEISSNIASRVSGTPRPYFFQDEGFYNFTVNNFYTRSRQRKTINNLLGLPNNSLKYIDNGSLYYLARGHLSARADFVYAAQQNATFKYINTAPHWQSFNGRNWNIAEADTRSYASSRNVSLQVWTGTYGIATLPHENTRQQVDLYLYVNNGDKAMPVPAMFWKLVYNPADRRGVVLIGLNNPHQSDVSKNIICDDVSSKMTWLNWNGKNIDQGYSYACNVASFRKVVAYAPSLPVSGLLI
ncbi:unnamed protein product [Phaedon cochleariae]|uniref:DNA/RNA non-specific endonuclease/pyrophosphatase/phosphodiesterase domain-containing protein n=1 Tax=Phaedon cochleariae TaxID=80249 RepID=A0A9P0GSF1_PHACE|nr:unnamed protein product [Phaedon cochleariae]